MGRTVKIPTGLWRGFLERGKRNDVVSRMLCYLAYNEYLETGDSEAAMSSIGLTCSEKKAKAVFSTGRSIAEKVDTKSFFFVDVSKLLEFWAEDKTDNEATLFAMYYALGSMQGKKNYFKTNNRALLSRMSGYDSIVDEALFPSVLSGLTKYTMRKLRSLMYEYYKVSFYAPQACRGFYFSTKLDLKELIQRVEFPGTAKENILACDTKRILSEIYP